MLFDFSQPNKFLQKNGFSSIPAVLAESEVVRWLASYFYKKSWSFFGSTSKEIIKPKKSRCNFTHDYTFGPGFIRCKTLDLILPEK